METLDFVCQLSGWVLVFVFALLGALVLLADRLLPPVFAAFDAADRLETEAEIAAWRAAISYRRACEARARVSALRAELFDRELSRSFRATFSEPAPPMLATFQRLDAERLRVFPGIGKTRAAKIAALGFGLDVGSLEAILGRQRARTLLLL